MINIAILGFGVVGGGVAELITKNAEEVARLGGDGVNIKYILDLRDFPDSPFADRIVHDFSVILEDKSVAAVIETMGGSHPAYEFTVAALCAGKSVITSNKEAVANFGDEFLALAKKNGVAYRFEAAVGGGIPVISPMLSCIGQNRIKEIRGILNGTTNYILTKMFCFGADFGETLADAQARGYAEKNPDADIHGTDACRKIAILAAIATGKLFPTEAIHTEGITGIRGEDVHAAEKIGCKIKLLARCIVTGGAPHVLVAPFMLSEDCALSGVSGVYNAVEIIGEPIGNVMLYGKGAGAGATASAVVGDLMQIMNFGAAGTPKFEKSNGVADFGGFSARHYLAFSVPSESAVKSVFPNASYLDTEECSVITDAMTESETEAALARLESLGAVLLSHIRLL